MKRLFKIGAISNIKDPAPGLPLATAIEFLSASFPAL